MPADWQLPAGVSRSLWEFAADDAIALNEAEHLATAPLLRFDHRTVLEWYDRPGRLIDLGCGTGRSLVEFSQRGFECTGVDLSQPSLCIAQDRLVAVNQLPRLVRANLCELGCFSSASFDYALLLFGTLGMVSESRNRERVLRETNRLLVPGGKLALHVHSVWPHLYVDGGRTWLVRDLWRRLIGNSQAGDTHRDYRGIPQIYHHVFTRRELHRLVRNAGFDIETEVALKPLDECSTDQDLTLSGPLRHWRATGWMLQLRKSSREMSTDLP